MKNTHLQQNTTQDDIKQKVKQSYEMTIMGMLIFTEKLSYKIDILNSLDEKMFENPFLGRVFKIAKELYIKNEPIDETNIISHIPTELCEEYMLALNNGYVCSANYGYYIEKVIDNYINKLIENVKTQDDINFVEAEKKKYQHKREMVKLEANANDVLDKYDKEKTNPIKTGFKALDSIIGSLQGGDYVIIAGAPSMGKTCFALNLLSNLDKMGKKVNLYSLEMSKEQLKNRMICAKSGIAVDKIRKYTLTEEERELYKKTAQEIFSDNIEICRKYDISIDKIKAIELASNNDIVLIDYLGLIQGTGKGVYESISDISREIKTLALDTNKVFIVLHQLSRKMDERDNKKPKLSDLRDSGKIEQDADMVWLLYRDSYYGKSGRADKMIVIIAKNRPGKSQIEVPLQYIEKQQLIKDFDNMFEGVFG